MSTIQYMKEALALARGYSDKLFQQFENSEEWLHQPHPNANHALWCAGHIARTDNMAIGFLAPEKAHDPEGYKELFGRGSQPSADAARYPNPATVVEYLNDRRSTLMQLLEGLDDRDLEKPTPPGAPDFLPTIGAVLRTLVWHEGLHAGQVSIAHRCLGKPPLLA
ncbi:MAG: DinB family protein [Planctomycetales bacterium]|nr:DinB family protein [Planctomycetales bacterium]